MLFTQTRPTHGARVAAFLRHLDLLCRNHRSHDLPLRMVLIGESLSHRGQPTAVYACPVCNCREGWVQDRHTGRPLRLWRRPGGNGR